MKALPCEEGDHPFLISPVQTFKAGDYPSIKDGYIVAQDSGFGIINGQGQIGGLVLTNGKAKGIITQIGKELESGFSRMIEWKHLPNILDSLKGKKSPYFGISAQAQESREGLQVVRIAPNSPLRY